MYDFALVIDSFCTLGFMRESWSLESFKRNRAGQGWYIQGAAFAWILIYSHGSHCSLPKTSGNVPDPSLSEPRGFGACFPGKSNLSS